MKLLLMQFKRWVKKTLKRMRGLEKPPLINIFEPGLGREELVAIKEVFDNKWVGKSKQALKFEFRFAESLEVDSKHFTSTTCCTEALFLAADLFEFGPGDEVIVPTISFNAVGNSVLASGATLVLCDVDPRTLNTSAKFIEPKITPRTKAIILNHYGGVPCDMNPIMHLCRTRNIIVIEDAACAVKSFYEGRAVGTIGDMGTWSFDAMKTVCTGDGGMIYLADLDKMKVAKELLYMGLPSRSKSGLDSSSDGANRWWEFDVVRPGRRAVMNNITGAMGIEQMKKLPNFLKRRKEIYDFYNGELGELKWLETPLSLSENVTSSYYFYWIQLEQRDELARFLLDRGIYTTFRYWPLHKIKLFSSPDDYFPNADGASEQTLNIPMHQYLNDNNIHKIVSEIKAFGRLQNL